MRERADGTSYDRWSRWYDLLTGPFERRYRLAGLTRLRPQAGEAILEIGFGTGHSLLALAGAVGAAGRACGVDLSWGMCHVARGRLARGGLLERAAVLRGDARRLPCSAGALDAVFMSFTLELFPEGEIPGVLGECRRVLRAGGRLGVVAMSRGTRAGPIIRLYEWLHRRLPRYVDCRPIPVQGALREAGFRIVEAAEMRMWGLPIAIVVATADG